MADDEIDWGCYVGTYEIWPTSKLPAQKRKYERNPQMLHLVQTTWPVKPVRPKREAFDMAVLRLLNTKLPRSTPWRRKAMIEARAEAIRLGTDDAHKIRDRKAPREAKPLEPAEYAGIAESALAIASQIGLITMRGGQQEEYEPGVVLSESLEKWVQLGDEIQAMFRGREVREGLPEDFSTLPFSGELQLYLVYKPDGVSMHLLPRATEGALIHHAAQMVTNGTKLQNCIQCKSPFFSGGDARGGGKRRRDARFCRDECRYAYHNEQHRRSRKKRL